MKRNSIFFFYLRQEFRQPNKCAWNYTHHRTQTAALIDWHKCIHSVHITQYGFNWTQCSTLDFLKWLIDSLPTQTSTRHLRPVTITLNSIKMTIPSSEANSSGNYFNYIISVPELVTKFSALYGAEASLSCNRNPKAASILSQMNPTNAVLV